MQSVELMESLKENVYIGQLNLAVNSKMQGTAMEQRHQIPSSPDELQNCLKQVPGLLLFGKTNK